jgi:sec-independent protein translocase protein TatC
MVRLLLDATGLAMTLAPSVLTLLALILLLVAIYRKTRVPPPGPEGYSYLEHAEEARKRLIRVLAHFGIWFTLLLTVRTTRVVIDGQSWPAFGFNVYDNIAAQIYHGVASRTVPEGVQIIVAKPTEAVAAQMGIAFLLAFILTLPALLLETWAFFEPALKPIERRATLIGLPFAVALFLAGCAFAFVYVVPLLLGVLYDFSAPIGAVSFLSASSLVGTVTMLLLVFGLAFQLPLVMAGSSAIGLVQPRTYTRYWRHAVVTIFILAAFITDPTIISQLLVAACLLSLYGIGLALSFAVARPRTADSKPT